MRVQGNTNDLRSKTLVKYCALFRNILKYRCSKTETFAWWSYLSLILGISDFNNLHKLKKKKSDSSKGLDEIAKAKIGRFCQPKNTQMKKKTCRLQCASAKNFSSAALFFQNLVNFFPSFIDLIVTRPLIHSQDWSQRLIRK